MLEEGGRVKRDPLIGRLGVISLHNYHYGTFIFIHADPGKSSSPPHLKVETAHSILGMNRRDGQGRGLPTRRL